MSLLLISILLASSSILLLIYACRLNMKLRHSKRELSLADLQLKNYAERQQVLESELSNLKSEVSQNILTDSLTGLPSRKVFEDRVTMTVEQGQRYQLTFGILTLDLDNFKTINDALGCDIGDQLLQEVGQRLAKSIRQVDTISRYVGDQFNFILPQLAKAETAVYVAQRLIAAVAQPFQINGHELFVTASVGIAIFPSDGKDMRSLIQAADNAMHQAKVRGRNTYQFYRDEMYAISKRELALNSHLRNDSIFEQFTLYCQPIVVLETKQVFAYEISLEWQHPDFGILKLADFIQQAENCGRITEIGDWIIRKVCGYLSQWQSSVAYPVICIIPVSAKQIEDPHFVHKLSAILQANHIQTESIILQLSGASILNKEDKICKVLNMLKHVGIQIAMSHFATGRFSLDHLRRFPIDYIKLDGNLIHDLTINNDNEAIIKMMVALAHTLQLKVIADGVESQKQRDVLREIGCEIVQGNLLGQPFLIEEFGKN